MKRKFSNDNSSKIWGFRITILVLLLGLIFLIRTIIKVDILGSLPKVSFQTNQENKELDLTKELSLGKTPNFHIHIQNKKNSICEAKAILRQNGREVVLGEYHSVRSKEKPTEEAIEKGVNLSFPNQDLNSLNLVDGTADLQVIAQDCSLRKRKTTLTKNVNLDFTPPNIQITSSQHYVNQGGSELATYKTSPDTVWSGAKIGPYYFSGFKNPGSDPTSGDHFVLFVYSYELPPNTKIEILAMDKAGNQSTALLAPAKFFPKEFRQRELNIDDNFIQTKVADIISNTPNMKSTGDNLKNFILVNRELRQKNAKDLIDLGKKSEEKFFWKDAFKPLGNAAVEGSFADYRTYVYQGAKVDQQVHLGFDLATVEKNPVTAAGAGKILYAGYLGIYGNTVVVDHGYGLTTLYGHLSSIDVKLGDEVSRGQKLGNTGTTGLAGGDHLHFSMMVQGVQTNPIEFWDQHWIQDHIYLRIDKSQFGKNLTSN